jgi:biotin operon repressor
LRTIDTKNDEQFLNLIRKYEPLGIGFREVKRKTGLSNDAINPRIKRLGKIGFLIKNSQRYISSNRISEDPV